MGQLWEEEAKLSNCRAERSASAYGRIYDMIESEEPVEEEEGQEHLRTSKEKKQNKE